MNKAKKNLIFWTIILNFLTVAYSIGMIIWSSVGVESFLANLQMDLTQVEIDMLIYDNIITCSVDGVINLAAAICLILNLKLYEKHFKASKKLFFAGLILNVLSSPLSIGAILLYIAHFKYMDIEVIKEEEKEGSVACSEEELKNKIEKLRKLKEQGVITEEEFSNEILKLL